MIVTFSVPKMKCGGCAQSITKALHEVDASAKVSTNLETKEVVFDSSASHDAALSALAAAGYPATLAH